MPNQITEACKGCMLCARICPVGAIQGERRAMHVIDARLCIDCDACGRVCAFSAVRDGQGRVIDHVKQKAWPKPVFDLRRCVACTICVHVCPTGAIGQVESGMNLHPFLRDAARCIGCGFCAQHCPTGAIQMEEAFTAKDAKRAKGEVRVRAR